MNTLFGCFVWALSSSFVLIFIFYYFMFHWRCFVAHSFIFYICSLIDINRLAQYIKAKEDRRNNNGATNFFLKRSKCFTGQHQWHSKVKLKRTHTVSDDGPTMTYKSTAASGSWNVPDGVIDMKHLHLSDLRTCT
jgi:hypothetical protein